MVWFDAAAFGTIMTAILGLYTYLYRMERRVTKIETLLFNGIVELRKGGTNAEETQEVGENRPPAFRKKTQVASEDS